MKKADIKVGGVYEAKVSGVLVHVKVTSFSKTGTGYNGEIVQAPTDSSSLLGKKTQFSSAAKFRAEVKAEPKQEESRVNGKPRLKHSTVPGMKKTGSTGGITKREDEHSSDPSLAGEPVGSVEGRSRSASQTPVASSKTCLGYDPSAVTGRCRCAVCLTKPRAERTARPFVGAQPVPPTSPVNTKTTSPSVTSSPRTGPPISKPTTKPVSHETLIGKTMENPPAASAAYNEVASLGVVPKTSAFGSLASQEIGMDNAPHIIVEARAGTGKTTTVIEGIKLMLGFGTHLTPSEQQQAVWDAMMQSKGKAKSVCFVAFNRSIAAELKRRVPPGCEAMTMHGMGFRAVNRAFRLWGGDRSVNEYRVTNILEEILKTDIQSLRRQRGQMVKVVQELVGLCKVNLFGYNGRILDVEGIQREALDELVETFDIDMDGTSRDECYPLIPQVLQRCLDVGKDRYIDYNDMIWLPIVLGLLIPQYDMLVGDEVQDWNRIQQLLAIRAVEGCGGRLILVGDPKQAIYAFAGADSQSMSRMADMLSPGGGGRGVEVLPLTVTRRCGHAIVAEANKLVKDFHAHETCPPGKISNAGYKVEAGVSYYGLWAKDGDMVLCRVNAPLVSECFRFIKAGKKANIQGRDVGKGLVKTVERMKAQDIGELVSKLQTWHDSEIEKENRKKFPSEAKIIGIQDKLDCLMCFIEGLDSKGSPQLVVNKIDSVFTDNKDAPGIRLSSIHKAKGLEAKRVFLLEPEGSGVPHPMAKTASAKEQEWNLRYVAITRAIEELVYVS